MINNQEYERRVQAYEAQGLTRSDAQGVVDCEIIIEDREYAEKAADLDAVYYGA